MDKLDIVWRKAQRSNNNGACVEVRLNGDQVEARDTKGLDMGPVLSFTAKEWDAFLDGAKAGEFEV